MNTYKGEDSYYHARKWPLKKSLLFGRISRVYLWTRRLWEKPTEVLNVGRKFVYLSYCDRLPPGERAYNKRENSWDGCNSQLNWSSKSKFNQ